MEVESDAFVAGVRALLDAETPLVAAVHGRSTSGFVGEVKCRADAETFAVALETRDRLPDRLVERILDAVG
jgi:nucleoside-triphosphatase THEP1